MKTNTQIADEIEAQPASKGRYVSDSWVLTCDAMDAARREGFEMGFACGMGHIDKCVLGLGWADASSVADVRETVERVLNNELAHWRQLAEAAFKKATEGT